MSKSTNGALAGGVAQALKKAEAEAPSNRSDIEALLAFHKNIAGEPAENRPYRAPTREATVRLSVPLDPHFHAKLKVFAALRFTTIEAVTKDALQAWMEKG